MSGEFKITKRHPVQPLILLPNKDGEYDDDADIKEMSEKIQEFLYGVSKGYSIQHSCALSGCKYDAMLRWLDAKHRNYKIKLHTLFKRAKAIFYAKQVDKVANAKDWRAAAMWLERHEADWNPKEANPLNIFGNGNLPAIKMDSETISALSSAYDARFKAKTDKTKKEDKDEIHTEQ